MNDPRLTKLAEVLLDHSCRVQAGETLLIEAIDLPDETLVCRLVELAAKRDVKPVVLLKSNRVQRSIYAHASDDALRLAGSWERHLMEQMHSYIGIRGAANNQQFADVPGDRMEAYQKLWWHSVHSEIRVRKTKWVVLRYPTDSMAQAAHMSTEAFENYYFDVCTADYAQMERDLEPLVQRMEATDQVRIVGPGTDLLFSIRGMNIRPCFGQRNIPDGECFTAPIRDSVQGTIRYNTPSLYQGRVFDNVEFEFRDGQIMRAACTGHSTDLNRILDADEGARYIGEFSIGCNNRVKQPMLDTLFDEKIGGSIHFTPGNAYDEADNGNRSSVHWDLVLVQTPSFGGGEIWFDGHLVRKDGRFIPDDLQGLNAGL